MPSLGHGTFPFLEVLIALDTYHRDDSDQRPLVLASYDAAASEHDAIALGASVGVLTQGHRLYPDLDAKLESTATAMLANLQDEVQHPPAATGSAARDQRAQGMTQSEIRTGASLLALLDQVDATPAPRN
ncbi:MAG TPA: hypothetical protein VN690_05725 [Terriglobales bacterium]|nr:hypothetical protein [Terriglobales bacterium]